MAFKKYKVYSFHEYVECITDIGNTVRIAPDQPGVLWSRGHRLENWSLQPTLTRAVKLRQGTGVLSGSSGRAMEEELRRQHYIAKNYHFLSKVPESKLEWMEVMQHHGVKTRILDWSESLFHSLIFSLECFLNSKEFRTEDRINCSPCIWLFDPIGWNMVALKDMVGRTDLLDRCMDSLPPMPPVKKGEIRMRMNLMASKLDSYLAMETVQHLRGIFNLSSIADELNRMERYELIHQLEFGEFYYCLFYLLVQVYLKSCPISLDDAMPLSIVESYHSERIRAQRGAFSIFPYYEEDHRMKSAQKLNIHLDAMENMDKGNGCLHKILLCEPDKIAFEIMNAGMNVTWLYPEMPVVANAIEQRKIYT